MRNANQMMDDDWINDAMRKDRQIAIAKGVAAFAGLVIVVLGMLYGFTQLAAV